MIKRVIILLLFVQFSFGQENESSLELDKEGKFSFGFKYESSFSQAIDGSSVHSRNIDELIRQYFGKGYIATDFNYLFSRKYLLGLQIKHQPKEKTGWGQFDDILMLGLRIGYLPNENFKIILTNSIRIGNYSDYWNPYAWDNNNISRKSFRGKPELHTTLSIIFNTGNLSPELGLTYTTNDIRVSEFDKSDYDMTRGFIMPSIGINYKLNPSRKRAIKKLTQAKNALDLELITQEEYDKIYVKYARFAKDKQ